MKNEKWFLLGVNQIEQKLKTNAASGLTRKAARSRVNKEAGSVFLVPKITLRQVLRDIFSDFSLILLLLTTLVALFFEEIRMGLTVMVLLSVYLALLGYFYYRSRRMTESLSSFFYPTGRVIRGGKLFSVDFRTLVVGDVILVEEGDILPCDARIVTSDGLRVRMRVDRERYVPLDKYAEGHVRPDEIRPSEMVNMLHAGSVIEKGSGRAIVTAVGRYTYLGALTGGLSLPAMSKEPKVLQQLRGVSSKLNLLLLILVLPFSLLSLLFSYLNGGTVLLSSAFLTALALVFGSLSHITLLLLQFFFTHKMRKMVSDPNPAVIRSLDTLERLSEIDYLFLLDGSLLNDGILHFSGAYCGEGEIRNYTAGPAARYLFEIVSLYHSAATKSLTTGISGSGNLLSGIEEMIAQANVDVGALKYRYTIQSYAPANMLTAPETLSFSDREHRYYLYVSRIPDAISDCRYTFIGKDRRELSEEGRQNLQNKATDLINAHRIPLIFSLANEQNPHERCFLGVIVLREGVDSVWEETVSRLNQMGCRVITFAQPSSRSSVGIPQEFLEKGFVSKDEFLKRDLPITYRFGRFQTYFGLDNSDIRALIDHAHQSGASVAVATFTEGGLEVCSSADVILSCAPIHPRSSGYLDEEIQSRELSGRIYSTSCAQTVKARAEVLLPRPSFGRGGLRSLTSALNRFAAAYDQCAGFLRYFIWMQTVRVLITAIPMLLGQTMLDARHLLFFSILIDSFAFASFLFSKNEETVPTHRKYLTVRSPKGYFTIEPPMLIAACVAGLSVLILPYLLSAVGILEQYFYRTEFVLTATFFLHLSVLFVTRFGLSLTGIKRALRNWTFICESATVFVFFLLCVIPDGVGHWFGFEKNPFPYSILSIVPSVLFLFSVWIGVRIFKNKKSGQGSRNLKK